MQIHYRTIPLANFRDQLHDLAHHIGPYPINLHSRENHTRAPT